MTHRTRHIQTRAPVKSFRFPILFPDSAPDPLLTHTRLCTQRRIHLYGAPTGSLRL